MNRRDFARQTLLASLAAGVAPSVLARSYFQNPLNRADFGDDFLWGVATAAYQIEGAWNADGKSPSVWDTFTHKRGNVKNNENGDVACDFYHRYPEDIANIKSMNFDVNRFSLAWTRIKPDGTGTVNQKGVDYYHRVIDKTLENGLQPWLTLYHWDLPQCLEDKGGWANRDIVGWFSEYVDFCTKEFGDKVKNWMIFNEPAAFTGLGYMAGLHAPGKMDFGKFKRAVHHVVLSQAEGGRIARTNVRGGNIGTTFSVSSVHPKTQVEKHQKAAARMDAIFNRLFIEPALGMGYPTDGWSHLKTMEKYFQPGDEAKMAFDFDFHGLQNYFRTVSQFSLFPPIMWASQVKPQKLTENKEELTDMGWEVYPAGIYEMLKKWQTYPGIKRIYVTENGSAWPDKVENGAVHDERRTRFFKDYLEQVLKAKREGVPVYGYFVWTLMDNFEWAEGFHPRFGLVHVDFNTQQRIIKDSGLWFRDFLEKK
jgi:beta-glucosidase